MWTRAFSATLNVGALLDYRRGSTRFGADGAHFDEPVRRQLLGGFHRQYLLSVRRIRDDGAGDGDVGAQAQQKHDLCWQYGCLVIANQSKNYRITEFRVREAARDGTMRWSENQFSQFGAALAPRKAVYLFKTGKPETCDWPVLFVLQRPETAGDDDGADARQPVHVAPSGLAGQGQCGSPGSHRRGAGPAHLGPAKRGTGVRRWTSDACRCGLAGTGGRAELAPVFQQLGGKS